MTQENGDRMREFKGFYKGVNLGGWLSQCGNQYTEEHYNSFVKKEDIARIASWGMDHVRLPIDYNLIQEDDGTLIEAGFKHIDDCLAWCKEYGLNTVLDLHKACGFVFDDENYCSFFADQKLQAQFIELWKEIARRYGNKENIAFELLNEVTMPEMAEPWNEIIRKTMPEIRKIADKTKVIVGGIYNSSITGLSLMEAPYDENMVFTYHCYSPFIFTHQDAEWIAKMPKGFSTTFPKTAKETMEESRSVYGSDFDNEFENLGDALLDKEYFRHLFEPAIAIAEKFDVPLYCGEYGVIDLADCDSTLRWFESMHEALEECKIGRAVWSYKKMNFGLIDKHYDSIREKIVTLL